jgi:WD40 repeat protein
VAFRPDSRQLAFGTNNHIQLCDIQKDGAAQAQLLQIGRASSPCVAYSPKGDLLAVSADDAIGLIALGGNGPPVRILPGFKGKSTGIAFSHDGRTLVAANEDSAVRVWNLATNPPRLRSVIPTSTRPIKPDLSPDGSLLAFGCVDGQVFGFDLSGDQPRQRWFRKAHMGWVTSVAFAPDGRTLVSTEGGVTRGRPTAAWWKADGTQIKEWPVPERCSQAAFDSTGRYLALCCHNSSVYILRLPMAPD